jgi:PAP2 superfamily
VSTPTRRHRVGFAVALVLLGAALAPTAQAAGPSASVIAWNDLAQRAVVIVGKQPPPQAAVSLAYVQAAVYDATVAVDGGGRPYALELRPRLRASVDAAVATAAHDMLVQLLPAQAASLDADYLTALAAIPDGRQKDVGIAVGRLAAEAIIETRAGDGYNADIGFVMPPPAPGVWQLPPGTAPLTPWLSRMRPFILDRPDRFRPGPPPALSSRAWANAFNEVKAVGGATSTVRTPEQSQIALFWTTHTPQQWNLAIEKLTGDRGLDVDQAARLFAMVNVIASDALIGCFDAKYHYLFWRPQFAVPQGDTDGNPATTGDPTWKPLAPTTPAHPEYPSAHGCYSMAAADALSAFLGTRQIDLDMSSTVTAATMPTRHFATVRQLIGEIQNARVWAGIHYRFSTLVGSRLGDQVARWDLRHGPFLANEDEGDDATR